METINAGLIAPAGYARSYVTMTATGCAKHESYTLFCGACDYMPVSHRVELSGDTIGLILDREDGSVIEWLTPDSGIEFATTVAHAGHVVIREDVWGNLADHPVARAAIAEARLYADCFSIPAGTLPPSE